MTPVERGMRALAETLGYGDWDAVDALSRDKLKAAARAVLEAIREPDLYMTESGAEIVRHVGSNESEEAYRNDAANTWRFMIAGALGQD
ncbi:hypothetical protein EDF58_10646 [Novosphingobium sp. PhB57]|jgi:hypothetical protein|uniref:hypothetical protein n=1 Tax=unclassified Novosphingobium TaxID=2644732 RepID=UPI0010534D2A|nr:MULTISPECIES: hypothetical protein [unclassified Novosphingobium]TCU55759.1 hypothetical protein EDF58_10646 [Novosphingobium sp. PhB57]TDW64885.1 hypothetical protein EDF57_10359 [Novosphingobium sp. PhB55]